MLKNIQLIYTYKVFFKFFSSLLSFIFMIVLKEEKHVITACIFSTVLYCSTVPGFITVAISMQDINIKTMLCRWKYFLTWRSWSCWFSCLDLILLFNSSTLPSWPRSTSSFNSWIVYCNDSEGIQYNSENLLCYMHF